MFGRCIGVTDGEYETVIVAGEKIQVAKEDFPLEQGREEAEDACKMLSNGWRLPNKNELEAIRIQLVQKNRGGFKVNQSYMTTDYNWILKKEILKEEDYYADRHHGWVRAVRPHP